MTRFTRAAGAGAGDRRRLLELLLADEGAAAPATIPRRRDPGPVPASFAQRRLWFLDQLAPSTSTYTIAGRVRLQGALEAAALQRALDEVVRRHEALRTTFAVRDGEPVQVVAPHGALPLERHDVRARPAAEREAGADAIAADHAERPFDLARGPLVRAALVTLPGDAHDLLLTMHHIVSDGWSLGVLFRELSALYAAYAAGEPSPLEPLALQYPDYAAWQREQLSGDVLAAELAHWTARLAGAPPALALPADHPPARARSARGGAESLLLPAADTAALHALAAQESATPFMVLLAAVAVVAGRLAGQDDLVLGTPVAGRTRAETEGLIGFFVNTLALRVDLSGEPTFRALLRRVRAVALEAYAHQELPFERLVEELQPDRDAAGTPLVQVLVNQLNVADAPLELGAAAPAGADDGPERWGAASGPSAKFDLTVYAGERDDRLRLTFVYARDRFERARMAELIEQLAHLIGAATAAPDVPAAALSLRTGRLPPAGLPLAARVPAPAVLERVTAHDPARLAIAAPGRDRRYGELTAQARGVAAWLRGQGVTRGDIVAIHAHRGGELAAAMLGTWMARAAFLVLDDAHPPARAAHQLRLARPSALLRTRPAAAAAPAGVPELVVGDAPGAGPAGAAWPAPDDLACLVATSGTTGRPRLVASRHAPIAHFLAWHAATSGLAADDRFALLAGLGHDPLLRDVLMPLWLGATLCVPGAHPGWAARAGVTVAHVTPSAARALAAEGPLPSLRRAFLGGDVVTGRDVRRLRDVAPGVRCTVFYGTTETPQAVAWWPVPDDVGEGALPLGGGIDAVELLVLGPGGAPAGVGELGELCVRTAYLADGYVDEPEATAARFVAGPWGDRMYRTGDLGRYDPAGRVCFAGRRDDQLKVRGVRIEPGEVADALLAHPAVRDAHVGVEPDAGGEPTLAAYVVPADGAAPSAAALRRHAAGLLPEAMIPTTWRVVAELPRNAGGKVDRAALRAAHAPARAAPPVAPRTELEARIAPIWAAVLGLEEVGVEDSFFDLGGHSLLATALVARVRAELGADVVLRELFDAPTVAGLARAVEAARRSGGDAAVPAIGRVPRDRHRRTLLQEDP